MKIHGSENTVSAAGFVSWLRRLFSPGKEKTGVLLLYLGPEAPARVHWAEKMANQKLKVGVGTLEEFAESAKMAATVLVPGSEVLLTEVEIPAGNRSKALQSVPYLIEEDLAEDVEALHFAFGRQLKGRKTTVAVVSRRKMETWFSLLEEAGVAADSICPVTLYVPKGKGRSSVVATGNDWLVRLEEGLPFTTDPENLSFFLELTENGEEGGRPGITFFSDEAEEHDVVSFLPGREIELVSSSFMETIAEGYHPSAGINLLQGDFGRSAEWRGLWQQYRFFFWALLLLAGMLLAGFFLDYYRLSADEENLDQEMSSVFLQAFPNSTRTDNPRMRMESRLKAMRLSRKKGDVFFRVYDLVVPVMDQSEGDNLLSLRFKDGRFDFDLELESLQALDLLKETLGEKDGLRVDIRNASASGDKVKATVQVSTGE